MHTQRRKIKDGMKCSTDSFHTKTSTIPSLFPKRMRMDPELGSWVQSQRRYYRNNALSDHRVNILNSIGFVWNTLDNRWDEMFQRLVAYKKQRGSTLVPAWYVVDPALGLWVRWQ
jgi:hypothetical protein